MSKGTILLTGLNGYIAGPTAEAFLKAGYKVRGTARSAASSKPMLDALSQYSDSIEVVEVPDITVAGAFDEAVKGVTHIAHLASPVSASFDDPEAVIHQAVTGAIRVLESAAKVPPGEIKTVVIMSSVAAIHSKPDPSDPAITTTTTSPPVRIFSEADWNTTAENQVKKLGKDAGFAVYEASKAAAERAVWKWRDENGPSFAITAVNPNFVAGPPLVVPPSKEKIPVTTSAIWSVFVGNPLEAAAISNKLPGVQDSYVDVRDVARVFLWALENPEKANGERYLLSAWYVPPQSVADILREKYPDRKDVIEEGTPGDGYMPDWTYPEHVRDRFDGSKAVKATGVDYIPWDKTVVDTVEKLKVLL